jgi:hypothetical protein
MLGMRNFLGNKADIKEGVRLREGGGERKPSPGQNKLHTGRKFLFRAIKGCFIVYRSY